MTNTSDLRLLAEDEDDLKIISAAVQDALCQVSGLQYDRSGRQFTLEVNRFRWETVKGKRQRIYERVRAGLSINTVQSVRSRNIPMSDKEAVLSVLALGFQETDAPSGTIALKFAGGGEMELAVECIDVTLYDTETAWPTRNRPDHDRET